MVNPQRGRKFFKGRNDQHLGLPASLQGLGTEDGKSVLSWVPTTGSGSGLPVTRPWGLGGTSKGNCSAKYLFFCLAPALFIDCVLEAWPVGTAVTTRELGAQGNSE